MTKHMWLALLIFGIFPLIVLFLFRKPIIENIKQTFDTEQFSDSIKLNPIYYDYPFDSTEYFDDVSDSLILDSIRIELLKKFENITVSIPYTWVFYKMEITFNEGTGGIWIRKSYFNENIRNTEKNRE